MIVMSATAPYPTTDRLAAIDGIRAIAVIAVMLYHCEIGWLAGSGFLGVDVFFVVSGFLITGQLIQRFEQGAHPQAWSVVLSGYRAFLIRRVWRLMPTLVALFCVLIVVCPLVAPTTVPRLLEDIPAGLLALSNVWQLISKQSYFESAERQALLQHLWSLAIEWHFYLVWPLILALALRTRGRLGLAWVSLAGALLSSAIMAWLSMTRGYPDEADPSRVYLGTDTHAMGLFSGALLASLWSGGVWTLPGRFKAATITALRGRLGAWCLAQRYTSKWPSKLWPSKLWSSVSSGLVHWLDERWPGLVAFFALLAIVLACDIDHESQGWLYRGGFLLASLTTAVLVFATTVRASPVANLLSGPVLRWCGLRSYSLYVWHWPVFLLLRPGHELPDMPVLAALIRIIVTSVIAEGCWRWVEMPLRRPPARGWLRSGYGPAAAFCLAVALVFIPINWSAMVVKPPTPTPTPLVIAPGAVVLTAIGDSVLLGMKDHLERTYRGVNVDAAVGRQGNQGLLRARALRDAGQLAPAVVVHLGTNGYLSERQLRDLLDDLGDRQKVVLVNFHAERRWVAPNNALLARVAPDYPQVTLVNWEGISRRHPEYFVQDGIHLTGRGIMAFADLIRGVVPLALAPPEPTAQPHLAQRPPRALARTSTRQGATPRATPAGTGPRPLSPDAESGRHSSEPGDALSAPPVVVGQGAGSMPQEALVPSQTALRDEP